jgi:hypothetical protein
LEKRDKTRQNPESSNTTSLPCNDLQQPASPMSHSEVAAGVRRQVTSQEEGQREGIS